MRGYWWSPDGESLLVARVDDAPVRRWYIADPANPDREPTVVAYPAAGTANARVSLVRRRPRRRPGRRRPGTPSATSTSPHVVWSAGRAADRRAAPRPARAAGAARSTRRPARPTLVHEDTDPALGRDRPRRAGPHRGRRACCGSPTTATRAACCVDGEPVTPPTLQVRRRARRRRRHGAVQRLATTRSRSALWTWSRRPTGCAAHPGAGRARRAAGRRHARRHAADARHRRHRHDRPAAQRRRADDRLARRAARRSRPRVTLHGAASGELRTARAAAVVAPSRAPRCRCCMDPYGGPHAQRVLAARGAPSDQPVVRRPGLRRGGRRRAGHAGARPGVRAGGARRPGRAGAGRPGRRPARASPREHPDLDLGRVGIRGWSFGGYLAALAVLRRPDVFHAAVAGAPGHRLGALRHPLHRALPRPSGRRTPRPTPRTSLLADAPRS